MKPKIFVLSAVAAAVLLCTAYAEKIPDSAVIRDVSFANDGEAGLNSVMIAKMPDETEYLIDAEKNIIGGPYEYVADYSGFPFGVGADGSKTLFDHDGSVIASVSPGNDIYPPKNGIYAVTDNENAQKVTKCTLYDYETRTELCTLDFFLDYYLEQQSDKMFCEKDGKWALIDKYGNYITDYIYDGVKKRFNPDYYPYPKAYAIVVQDGREKYIDRDLNEIDLDNYNGGPFITNCTHMYGDGSENFMDYYLMESGEKTGIYDLSTETYLIPLQTQYKFYRMNNEYIIAEKDGLCGALDYSGNEAVPFEYSYLDFYIKGFWSYSKNDGDTSHGGLYDPIRKTEVTANTGGLVENGIFIRSYSDYSTGYREYCAEILDAAGRNLTGEIYHPAVQYTNGRFYKVLGFEDAEPADEISVNKDFAVIKINNKYLDYDGIVKEGRTLVPIRDIIENLGGSVSWNDGDMSAVAEFNGTEIAITVNSYKMTVNGSEKTLDVPAQLIGDKTMVPLRALAEAAGFNVDWDERINCVYIEKAQQDGGI